MEQVFSSRPIHSSHAYMSPVNSTVSNKYISTDGTELILHEFDYDGHEMTNILNGQNSKESNKKKRGRPKKNTPVEDDCSTSFETSPITKSRTDREERKIEKRRHKLLLRKSFEDSPKKRGRPRKFLIDDQIESNVAQENFTDVLMELNNMSEHDFYSSSLSYTDSSGLTSKNSSNMSEDVNGMCRLLQIQEEGQQIDLSRLSHLDSNDSLYKADIIINWSPIQRLTQLNQALAIVNMYKDLLYWDRITSEFFDPNIQFRLEVANEKSFDIPFIVLSKMFWLNSQIGLNRLQFIFNGINESFIPKSVDNPELSENIQFNSSDSLIMYQYYKERMFVMHKAFQFVEFNSFGKIVKWNIQILKQDRYFHDSEGERIEGIEEFRFGFPKRLIEFLEAALVMNSLVPDSSNWLTWFYTYIRQREYHSMTIVDLSRPPSPFQSTHPTIPDDSDHSNCNMEFIGRGQDYIFSILNGNENESTEVNHDDFLFKNDPVAEFPIPVQIDLETAVENIFSIADDNDNCLHEQQEEVDFHEIKEEFIDNDDNNCNNYNYSPININNINCNSINEFNSIISSSEYDQDEVITEVTDTSVEEDDFFDNYG